MKIILLLLCFVVVVAAKSCEDVHHELSILPKYPTYQKAIQLYLDLDRGMDYVNPMEFAAALIVKRASIPMSNEEFQMLGRYISVCTQDELVQWFV